MRDLPSLPSGSGMALADAASYSKSGVELDAAHGRPMAIKQNEAGKLPWVPSNGVGWLGRPTVATDEASKASRLRD